MKKVPLTKKGEPDKRYVKSVKSPSKVTKKAPTKRTVKRCVKNVRKGYYPNPVGKTAIFAVAVSVGRATGYLSKLSPLRFNDDASKALHMTQAKALDHVDKLEAKFKTKFRAVRLGSKKP
jgi:hypothetical protein